MNEIQFQPIEPKRLAFELRGIGKDHRSIQMELNRAAFEVESYGEHIAALEAELAQWRNVTDRKDPEDCRAGIKVLYDNWQTALTELAKVRVELANWKAGGSQGTIAKWRQDSQELAKVKADYAALQASCDTAALVLAELNAERDAAVAAWECAKRQNAHDMLLSGDEIHKYDAAIYAARKEGA